MKRKCSLPFFGLVKEMGCWSSKSAEVREDVPVQQEKENGNVDEGGLGGYNEAKLVEQHPNEERNALAEASGDEDPLPFTSSLQEAEPPQEKEEAVESDGREVEEQGGNEEPQLAVDDAKEDAKDEA
ncbi:hypothetical protein FOL47_006937, partial [Perkinsus chesapeaki]